jgi:hypothetical protein
MCGVVPPLPLALILMDDDAALMLDGDAAFSGTLKNPFAENLGEINR